MLGLGLFLLGGIGFAVDLANLWMHRQSSQNAADAACTAAAMDMVNDANGVATTSGGFTPGTAFNCSTNASYAPCQYAGFNGYTANGLTAGTPSTEVAVSFPSSVPGVQSCSGTTPTPTVCSETGFPNNAFVSVTVTDRMQSFFVGLLSGGTTMDVGASATCGAVLANAPIPILVLNPTLPGTFTSTGNFLIKIVGGPQRSIQVDSSSATAVNFSGGSGTVDLSEGGPPASGSGPGTGSDFAVTSSETQPSGPTFSYGSTGGWRAPRQAISDPFATIPAPGQPTFTTPAVVYGDTSTNFGCPDTIAGDGCDHYKPGYYPNGITVKNGKDADNNPNGSATGLAVFEPGIYYLGGAGLKADSNSCLRPSTATGDGSGGTMFYFSGTSTLKVTSNSGKLQLKTGSTVNFDCQNLSAGSIANTAWAVSLAQLRCIPTGTAGETILPDNVKSFGGLVGNVLLGPCHAPATGSTLCAPNCTLNYGDPLGASDPLGEQRGMLFFQNRSGNLAAAANQPLWQGGAAFGLAGNLYFHYCASSTAGGGAGCSSTAFTDQLSLGGNSTSNTFVVGDIVTDELSLNGNPGIEMDLNPNALYYVLKASLLQ
jgi:hypothetical protein